MRLPEHDDAERASLNIGTYEIDEANESVSYGANTMRDGVSVSRHTKEKRLVLLTEIQLSPDLHGYLRVKGEFPAAGISLEYVNYPVLHEEFIAREMDPDPLQQKVEKLVEAYSDPVLAAEHDQVLQLAESNKNSEKKVSDTEKHVDFL